MPNKSKRPGKRKPLIIILAILVIAVGGTFLYHYLTYKNPNNLINDKGSNITKAATSTPTAPQPQTNSSTNNNGGAVDTNGQTNQSLPNSSLWVASNNGNITLQAPSPNTTLQSGDSIIGLAKVNSVQFLLTDSSVGEIAQGNLNVVNGKFSGKLEFTPHSSSGTLQVYYPNPSNGGEEDVVDINVKFND